MKMSIEPGLRILDKLDDSKGKMVQLYVKDIPILVIGHTKRSHGEILEQVLEESRIRFNRIKLRGERYYAEKQGELYVAVGMGSADLDEYLWKQIFLSGKCFTYKLTPNYEHSKRVQLHIPEYKLFIA